MACHSSTLAWKIPWTEEPGRLQFIGSWRVRHDWATSLSLFTFMHWRRKWQPTPVFLPGESQRWGSLVGYRLWGHAESDTTEVTQQQHKSKDFNLISKLYTESKKHRITGLAQRFVWKLWTYLSANPIIINNIFRKRFRLRRQDCISKECFVSIMTSLKLQKNKLWCYFNELNFNPFKKFS